MTRNGLLLCACCHTKYDKNVKVGKANTPVGRSLQIDEFGVIRLYGKAKEVNYKNLHGQYVPWADLIDKDPCYPDSATLKYALDLKIVGKNKRCRELSEEFALEQASQPKLRLKKRRSGGDQARRVCDIAGCARGVHIFDPDLQLYLCAEHGDVQYGDIDW